MLEAAAFSPVRTHVQPTAKPTQVSDELLATVKRVGPLLPQIAALFEIEVSQGAVGTQAAAPDAAGRSQEAGQGPAPPAPPPSRGQAAADATDEPTAAAEARRADADSPLSTRQPPSRRARRRAAEVADDSTAEPADAKPARRRRDAAVERTAAEADHRDEPAAAAHRGRAERTPPTTPAATSPPRVETRGRYGADDKRRSALR